MAAKLLPQHAHMLKVESKIKDDVIQARPWISISAQDAPSKGFTGKQALDGLLYAIHPPDGSNHLYGLRPDKPRLSKVGKTIKYEHPFGKPPRLDIPLPCHAYLNDLAVDIIITEGAKKADSILSNLSGNYLIIDLCNGVYGWLQNHKVIPDIDLIIWVNRHCYLIFDNDVAIKPAVRFALNWLTEELTKRGATLSTVYLPFNFGKKLGVDDYFATGKTGDDLLELMRLSRIDIPSLIDEVEQAQGNPKQRIELMTWLVWRLADLESFIELEGYIGYAKSKGIGMTELKFMIKQRQKMFEAKKPTDDEIRDMYLEKEPDTAYGLEEWRRYKDGIWPAVNAAIIGNEIEQVIESLKSTGIAPDSKLLGSVTTLARLKVYKPDDVWDSEMDYLCCKNGVLRLSDRTLLEHDPDYYLTSGVEHDYNSKAKAPNWKSFLKDLEVRLGDDGEAIITLIQEFFGLALTPDCSHEIALWLKGNPGSGKSTLLEGAQSAVGDKRTGTLSLAKLDKSPFALTNLPGRTLLLSTEQPADYISCSHLLNAIISGEKLPVERKYKDEFDVRSIAKLCFAMNELPRIGDPNSGLYRRVKVIQFPDIPVEERDPTLKEAIKKEGEGILIWMLDGLDGLRKRGHFEIPDSVENWTTQFKDSNDPELQFLLERCWIDVLREVDPTIHKSPPKFSLKSAAIYAEYVEWCKDTGHKQKSTTRLGSELERLGIPYYAPGNNKIYKFIGLLSDSRVQTEINKRNPVIP